MSRKMVERRALVPGVELVITRPHRGDTHYLLYLGKRSPETWWPLVVLGWHRDDGSGIPVYGAWTGVEVTAYPPRNLGGRMRGPKFSMRTPYLRRRRFVVYVRLLTGMFEIQAGIQTRPEYD
jgi:hypothetical protein